MNKTIIKTLRDALNSTDQEDLFGGSANKEKEILNCCQILLIEANYQVIEPLDYATHIKSSDQLLDWFYERRRGVYGHLAGGSTNKTMDRRVIHNFIKARMKANGVNKASALKECVLIIDTIFDNAYLFRFKEMPNIGILGQAKCGWVTDKAVGIVSKKLKANKDSIKTEVLTAADEEYDAGEDVNNELDKLVESYK